MLCVRGLDIPEELRDVGVVTEAYESLRIVTGDHYVVALVLTAELIVVLYVIFPAGMALYGHVAGGMVAVVPIETYREIALELLHAILAHQIHALLVDEGAIVDVELLVAGLHDHADLHRNEVEDPGGITHLLGKFAELLHIRAAPDSLEIARLGPERILHQLGADVGESPERHELQVLRIVVEHVPVGHVVLPEFVTVPHGTLEVAVVAAAYRTVDYARTLLSEVGILAPAYAQHTLHRSKVEEYLHIVEFAEFRNERAVAINHADLAGLPGSRDRLFEGLGAGFIHKSLISTLINLSIE